MDGDSTLTNGLDELSFGSRHIISCYYAYCDGYIRVLMQYSALYIKVYNLFCTLFPMCLYCILCTNVPYTHLNMGTRNHPMADI